MLLDDDGNPIVDLIGLAKNAGIAIPTSFKTHRPSFTKQAATSFQQAADSDGEDESVVSPEHHARNGAQSAYQSPTRGIKRKADDMVGEAEATQVDFIYPTTLPSKDSVVMLVDYFCVSFHHYIPFVNKPRLKAKAREARWAPGLQLLLHAIVAACLPHVDPELLNVGRPVHLVVSECRDVVMRHAIGELSIASLQSLVVLVCDLLNSGQQQRAWPLISSLTRAVDYMQLTVDPSLERHDSLMRPLVLLPYSDDWTENEERRRLFWIVFLFDRFCTVHNGWNTSLTSEDVHQRLPADGYYFTREEPVLTPYFGIWNKSEARIGRSLMDVPASYKSTDQSETPVSHRSARSPTRNAPGKLADPSHLGAFAYCIEATESLCQVVAYFIRQPVDWESKKDVLDWLTRFKELDLRLLNWKRLLPPKWKDSNIARAGEPVNMDPNLTIAHLSHNTSTTLLHYPIAYPPAAWSKTIPLPSACSAETCRLAASETLQIVTKFLSTTDIDFVNHQFTFCVYIAAKSLLGGPQEETDLQVLDSLVNCLNEISARWQRRHPDAESEWLDQAAKYRDHVKLLKYQQHSQSNFTFDFFDHSGKAGRQQDQSQNRPNIVPPSRPQTGDPRMDFDTLCHPSPQQGTSASSFRQGSVVSANSAAQAVVPPLGQATPSQWAQRAQSQPHAGPTSMPAYNQASWTAPESGAYPVQAHRDPNGFQRPDRI
ncbi:Tropolone cluster transcription factor tropK-like protein [Elsinoe fawcettii]|nr:Tropolone cluster transcription factor tropK-like protein [Elsinoe fawcettii]